MKNETLFGADDSLTMNDDVGSWSEEKYAQFRNYTQILTSGMSNRWDSQRNQTSGTLYALNSVSGWNPSVFCQRRFMRCAR